MPLTPLFSRPDDFALCGLGALFHVLDEVMPMNGAQKRDLAMACRDLSALLTTERDALSRPYWTSPRFTSAYLRYFLPWNLVRLCALMPGLDLGTIPEEPLILDMGSGPMTLPLALWLSRPDLRRRPVTMVVSDTSPHILELGRSIFERLRSELDPGSPWTIRTMRATVTQGLHRIYAKPGTLWMISMGNVLNEMEERRAKPGHQMADRMRSLLEDASSMLMEGGLLFSVEPGTRQGGRLITHLRKSALGGGDEAPEYEDLTAMALREEQFSRKEEEEDWFDDDMDLALEPLFRPLSPCPHHASCPMLDRRATAWCHVNAPADHAPKELREISARAGLDKDSVSLSFLLLRKLEEGEELPGNSRSNSLKARIISDAFPVPGYPGRARYACTERGLALVPDAAHLPPGALCEGRATSMRDRKSDAFILLLEDLPARNDSRPRQEHAPSAAGSRHPHEKRFGHERPFRGKNEQRRGYVPRKDDEERRAPGNGHPRPYEEKKRRSPFRQEQHERVRSEDRRSRHAGTGKSGGGRPRSSGNGTAGSR